MFLICGGGGRVKGHQQPHSSGSSGTRVQTADGDWLFELLLRRERFYLVLGEPVALSGQELLKAGRGKIPKVKELNLSPHIQCKVRNKEQLLTIPS